MNSEFNTSLYLLSHLILTKTHESADTFYMSLFHNREKVSELLSNVYNFIPPGKGRTRFECWKLPDV